MNIITQYVIPSSLAPVDAKHVVNGLTAGVRCYPINVQWGTSLVIALVRVINYLVRTC